MNIWSFSQIELQKDQLGDNVNPIADSIIRSKDLIPKVLVNNENQISTINLDEKFAKDTVYLKKLIKKFELENEPIEMSYLDPETNEKVIISTLYYGNSTLLTKLKYYPLALLLIILLFASVVYFFYRSSKNAMQNKLWSGMAKETAHQIGTPLSSLIGWTEILKSEEVNPEYIKEIEKDVGRLQTITDRFSKIGSMPKLESKDIVKVTKETYDYLKARSSKLIQLDFEAPSEPIFINLNEQLYSWTIENLVKNAIDAMKGKGHMKIEILPHDKYVNILVSDDGKGIPKNQYRTIFEPGYTSKKRGWGLGLSLAKRIVEDYHTGKIKVLHSEIGKGTTMQISLKTL